MGMIWLALQNIKFVKNWLALFDKATTTFGGMGIQIVTGCKFVDELIGGRKDDIAWNLPIMLEL